MAASNWSVVESAAGVVEQNLAHAEHQRPPGLHRHPAGTPCSAPGNSHASLWRGHLTQRHLHVLLHVQSQTLEVQGRVIQASLLPGQVMQVDTANGTLELYSLCIRLWQHITTSQQPQLAEVVFHTHDADNASRWVRAINDSAYAWNAANPPAHPVPGPSRLLLSDRLSISQNSVLGSGLFATVFLATDVLTGQQHAIKVRVFASYTLSPFSQGCGMPCFWHAMRTVLITEGELSPA